MSVVSFTLDSHPASLVAAYLSAEHGVAVRAGRFCAHRLLARIGAGGGAVRASIGLGSRAEDVERMLAGLEELIRSGPGAGYAERDGRFELVADDRPLPPWLRSTTPLHQSPNPTRSHIR